MEIIFLDTRNSKMNEPHKFVLKMRLKKFKQTCCSSKRIYLLHLGKLRKQYKNNKLKITASTWNDEFALPDGSYSVPDIQDYIEYTLRNMEY